MHQRIYDIYRLRIHRMLGNENRNIYPQSIPLKTVFAKTKDPVPFSTSAPSSRKSSPARRCASVSTRAANAACSTRTDAPSMV